MNEQLKEAISEAIHDALGDAMDCTRVWSAWGVGTMSQDDFSLVANNPSRVAEIADAVLGVIASSQEDERPSWLDGGADALAMLLEDEAALAAHQKVGENPAWRDELVRDAYNRGLADGLNADRQPVRQETPGASSFCSDERPCTPCFSDQGVCEDATESSVDSRELLRELCAAVETTLAWRDGKRDEELTQLLNLAMKLYPSSEIYTAPPAPAAVPVDVLQDAERLDFLDQMNATLNARYGTNYGWQLILSPQIVRLMAGKHASGYVADIDLNDSHGGNAKLPSCRAAIDAAILATHPQPEAAGKVQQ